MSLIVCFVVLVITTMSAVALYRGQVDADDEDGRR
jgi:hypothetical protein